MKSCEWCIHSSLRDNGLEYDWLMCDCLESDFYDTEVEDELDKAEECDCYEEYDGTNGY